MKKRIFCVIAAVIFCLNFAAGCASKQKAEDSLRQSLLNIFSGKTTAVANGVITNANGETLLTNANTSLTKNDKGYEYAIELPNAIKSGTINSAINLTESLFIDYLYNVVPKLGTITAESFKDKYVLNINLDNLSGFIEGMVAAVLNNISRPFSITANEYFRLSGYNYDIDKLVKVAETADKASVTEAFNLIDKALEGSGLSIKMLVNTFIKMDTFYGEDGFVIDGVTLYDDAYCTLLNSFSRMNFGVVMTTLISMPFNNLINLIFKSTTAEILRLVLPPNQHSIIDLLVSLQGSISCEALEAAAKLEFYANKKTFDIYEIDYNLKIRLLWRVAGYELEQLKPLNLNETHSIKFSNVKVS